MTVKYLMIMIVLYPCPALAVKRRRSFQLVSGEQRIAVDTHVFRVANRIGLVRAKNVLKTELEHMRMYQPLVKDSSFIDLPWLETVVQFENQIIEGCCIKLWCEKL